jgi:hypothetical protein
MEEYDLLSVLSLATLLWFLFFLNLFLRGTANKGIFFNLFLWNVLYILLLISALVVTLIVIAESIKMFKRRRMAQQEA